MSSTEGAGTSQLLTTTALMTSARLLLVITTTLALLSGASTPLLAQRCLGIAMPRRTYVGVETRHAWIGDGRQAQVYGGRLAHRFATGAGVGITASFSAAGGSMRGDSTAVHLSGFVAASRTLPSLDDRLSACVAIGIELNGVDVPTQGRFIDGNGDGFVSAPVTVGLGYDVRARGWTITPFAAPTIARYAFESASIAGGAQQRGWDGYVTLGSSASVGRWTLGASSRYGDRATRSRGRLTLRAGVSF